MTRFPVIAAACCCLWSGAANAQALGFEEALRIGTEAVKAAKAKGQAIAVVIANPDGRVIAALRMDGVSYVNLEVAESKAVTAGSLSVTTAELAKGLSGGDTSLLAVPGLMPVGGGIPVMRDGHAVAGVGVSGGTPEDDARLATAAVAAAQIR